MMKIAKILICTFALGCVATQVKAGRSDNPWIDGNQEIQQQQQYEAAKKQKEIEDAKNTQIAKQLEDQQNQIELLKKQLKEMAATQVKK